MPLNVADIATVSRLLDEGLALPPEEREAWLDALPQDLRHHAQTLRDMFARESRLDLEQRLAGPPSMAIDEAVARAGDVVGPYRLLREIGRGGMGSVWLAERADGAYRRQVALKLPRLAWGAGLAARMARERDIGALLEHPNIARLYDAGVDDRGRPYLALELIDGVAIDAWCQKQALDLHDRLRLFLQVTGAVAHAHGRLVVHRDLKPSNVLVSPDGAVHLLDFGIAQLLESDMAADATRLTLQHGRVLTPHYAAPEQIAGDPVTVQADVYSLGVLLYELLTGQLPVASQRSTPAAVEDAVLRGELSPASTRAASPAQARALRGEIDAILAMALNREPAHRYGSVQALAQDIERHLAGEPISAQRDGTLRRLRKALRRHRVVVGAGAAVLAAVLAGSAVAVLQAHRALQAMERERAVKDFVAEVFRLNAPRSVGAGELNTVSAEDFLQRSAALAEQRFADRPALQADVYAMVGGAFADMGAHKLAAAYGQRRLDRLETASVGAEERARAVLQLATALLGQRAYPDAQMQARRALAGATSEALRTEARVLLARVLLAQDQRAEVAQLLDTVQSAPGQGGGSAAAWALGLRARLRMAENRLDEAEPMMEEAIRAAHAAEGPDSSVAVELHLAIAYPLAMTTMAARAGRHNEAAVAILGRRGGNHAVRAIVEAVAFAAYRLRAGHQLKRDEALAVVGHSRRALADGGYVLPLEMSAYMDQAEGVIHAWTGGPAAALPLLERAHGVLFPAAVTPSEQRALLVPYSLALQESGHHEQADRWRREVLRLRDVMGLAHHPHTMLDYLGVAENLTMAGRASAALALLDKAPTFGEAPGEGAREPNRYGLLLQARRAIAHVALGNMRQARALMPVVLLANPGDRQELLPHIGQMHCAMGETTAGLALLTQALDELAAEKEHPQAPAKGRLHALSGLCALGQGDRQRALRFAHRAREIFIAQPAVSPYYKASLFELERALGLRLPPV